MRLEKKFILIAGFGVEAVLALVFFVWAFFTGFSDALYPSPAHVAWGIVLAVPLLLFNFLIFEVLGRRVERLRFCLEFVDQIVKPLADVLGWGSGLFVSICAGVGEELFFRGVLQTEFGIVVASLLFSLLHFGTAVKDHLFIALLYVVIGFYLGLSYLWFDTLWVPIILHASYDYFALIYLRYFYSRKIGE